MENITIEDIFEGVEQRFKYAVVYDEVCRDKGTHLEESFGIPKIETYDNGEVAYTQTDYFENKVEAEKRLSELSSIVNKRYENGQIIER